MSNIRWVSFQSLIGGMMIGAEEAFGCPPICTIDYKGVDEANSSAYVHYMNNIRNIPFRQLVLDGNLLSGAKNFEKADDEIYFKEYVHDIDVVCAVPICSGLSASNPKNEGDNARGADAVQNNNMINITEFTLEKIKPRAYIFENAPGLFTPAGNKVRNILQEIGSKYKYSVTWVKTDTMLHDNVQRRQRTFGIFWKDSKCPRMNVVNHPYKGTISEYLTSISKDASLNTNDDVIFKNYEDNGFIKYLKAKYGDDFKEKWPIDEAKTVATLIRLNNDFEYSKQFLSDTEKVFVEHMKEKNDDNKNFFDNTPLYLGKYMAPIIYLRTLRNLLHPTEDRGYTIREAMKLMGMPDDFEYPNAYGNKNYIGQNVPALTARDWCLQIKDFLNNEKRFTSKTVDMFDNIKEAELDSKRIKGFVFGKNKTLN